MEHRTGVASSNITTEESGETGGDGGPSEVRPVGGAATNREFVAKDGLAENADERGVQFLKRVRADQDYASVRNWWGSLGADEGDDGKTAGNTGYSAATA